MLAFQGRVERVFDMLHLVTTAVFNQTDDVEADRQINIELPHVGVGCCDDPTDFFHVDGFFGESR